MTTVAVLDYGSGNIHSVHRALMSTGVDVSVTQSRRVAVECDGLVIPGVGAFSACMRQLRAIRGDEIIWSRVDSQRPILAICVGHQIMFSSGMEHGKEVEGIGVLTGVVEQLPTHHLPHMGWNSLMGGGSSRYFADVQDRYYFVHSYGVLDSSRLPEETAIEWTEHDGSRFVSAVESAALLTTQFHPEKSGKAGLRLVKRWVDAL